jgi:hypothetical protein
VFCLSPLESLSSSFRPSKQSSHPTNTFLFNINRPCQRW